MMRLTNIRHQLFQKIKVSFLAGHPVDCKQINKLPHVITKKAILKGTYEYTTSGVAFRL